MKRRTFLKAGAAAVGGLSATAPALAHYQPAANMRDLDDIGATVSRMRRQFLENFDAAYVDNAILPYFLVSVYGGERLALPMIGTELTKENALPYDLWGMLSEKWKPDPDQGVTVFLQGLEKRGQDNRRKRIYMSAVTPDLYRPMYGNKVVAFFDKLLDKPNAGQPLMTRYLASYWDLYWDLHLGVTGDAIPPEVRNIGNSFNTVLAYRDPTQKIVYDNYMQVRANLPFLKSWISDRLADIRSGRAPNPEMTFGHYWMKNGEDGPNFRQRDVVFECFHNFVAFSQWGNTLYNIMLLLSENAGDADVQASFHKTMESNFDDPAGAAFSPLECFVMELFRTITPNGGSISAMSEVRPPPFNRHGYVITPHAATSMDPRHWKDPQKFDPGRYAFVPTSHEITETRAEQIGFVRCPFDPTSFPVKDGRNASLNNSAFGTVYGVADGRPMPVCDYAGFAPFGFGYRRCPGEQLTINVVEDFLRKVWNDKITFSKLDLTNAALVPIGPRTVIGDNIGFNIES